MTYANLQKELATEEAKRTNKLLARMLKIVEKLKDSKVRRRT